jgi:hypothetical protein
MKKIFRYLLLSTLPILAACGEVSTKAPAKALHTTRLKAIPIVSSQPSLSLRWPEFLLADEPNRYLWGEGREVFRVETSSRGLVLSRPVGDDFSRGLGKLIAAARTPDGTLAVLDVSGRVAIQSPTEQTWRFETHLENEAGGLAVTKSLLYLLQQGQSRTSSAVTAYTFSGSEIGRWGEMPADGIIQSNLKGGGIAACPDGSVFYSYINSPQIFHLQNGAEKSVRPLGEESSSFKKIRASAVFEASEEGMRSGSARPLVKLGLSASRVMSLLCSEEGLLFRQVAQPAGKGAYVEVWDPVSGMVKGTVHSVDGVLLDVRGRTLYLGTLEHKEFRLERVQFHLDPFRSEKEIG